MAKTSYELLGDIRSSIEDILAKMLQVKKEGRGSNINLRELLTESSVMFVDLRQVCIFLFKFACFVFEF